MQHKRTRSLRRTWTFDPQMAEPERLSALYYYFAMFLQKADPGDISLLASALVEWADHPDVDGGFTYTISSAAGLCCQPSRTLSQLRRQLPDYAAHERIRFVAEHLDVLSANYRERAFLALCQLAYRETNSTQDSKALLDRVAEELTGTVLFDQTDQETVPAVKNCTLPELLKRLKEAPIPERSRAQSTHSPVRKTA
jgi:hypothetical protein